MEQIVRKPAVAGQFYPGNPAVLRKEIEHYLENASAGPAGGTVVALVSPHAGYIYSGQVAAYGYRLIRDHEYKTVVVISPSHVEYFDYCSVFAGASYLTPLGEIPIDHEIVDLITTGDERVKADSRGHLFGGFQRGEHALEVQLPFLQVAIGDFELVPIVMGDQGRECVEALGTALGNALQGRDALIVASTDLSHFHGDADAKRLDGVFMDRLGSFDEAGLTKALARKDTEACGGGPTAAAMIAARMLGANRCSVLQHANSGDITGDTSSVVGYISAAMIRDAGNQREERKANEIPSGKGEGREAGGNSPPVTETGLTQTDKEFLLTLARRVIATELEGGSIEIGQPPSAVLREPRGGFVTLKKNGQLRGCIGYIEAIKPLVDTVVDMAKAAAFNDRRFPPVTADEVPRIDIEISVLSPITRIDDPSMIEVGTHGIIITRGSRRGLLLPQVAIEWGWDRDTFLDQTCVKAGLPADAWKQPGTKIEVFSADVFSEIDMKLR
ncbi:MAG TPA: AmmeMemoRadiSam system protein B [Patescibacteria group bacterium]|nr:AmmeMemoRadiSam system protein B [Patescibacteria group bacterium]